MMCDRVQCGLSDHLDGRRLDAAGRRHLESCADCDGFLSESRDFARRYQAQVARGLSRLRREPVAAKPRRPLPLVSALAAAVLIGWLSLPRADVAVPPAPAEPSFVRLYDDAPPVAEIPHPLVWIPEAFLPIRLDQDLLPPPADVDLVAVLPASLRF